MTVERLTRGHRGEVVRVLTASFLDYPATTYMLGTSPDFTDRLAVLCGFFTDARFARGYPVLGVREGGDLAGVALVSEPDPADRPPEIAVLFGQLETVLGAAVLRRMRRYEDAGHDLVPPQPHHFLGMVGVLPEHQGKGYGRRLIEATQELAVQHPRSTGVCLHTEVPANVGFYRHLGFETVFEADVEGVHTWCMFWKRP